MSVVYARYGRVKSAKREIDNGALVTGPHVLILYSGSKKCPNVCMIWKDQSGVIC
jgi:hypothetical protein